MKKSIKELFAALEGDRKGAEPASAKAKVKRPTASAGDESAAEERGNEPSAAEKVGRALLDRLGNSTGMEEDELADAIIAVWDDPDTLTGGEPPQEKRPYEEPALEVSGEAASSIGGEAASSIGGEAASSIGGSPFGEHRRIPVPLRSGSAEAAPVDYDELTREQFMKLKKQLKKAAADGKRVRL